MATLKSDPGAGITGTPEDIDARVKQFGKNEWPAVERHGDDLPSPGKRRYFVLRNGAKTEIDASELVVGDILFLDAGNQIPCDCVALQASDGCTVYRGIMTGEALPAAVTTGQCLYAITIIESGSVKALVVAVAPNTDYARL